MGLDASRIGSHGGGETAAGFVAAPCHGMAETLREKPAHIAAVCAPMKDDGADDGKTHAHIAAVCAPMKDDGVQHRDISSQTKSRDLT
jgi:hypothetical protein